MSENPEDALLELGINDDQVLAQLEKVEAAIQRLGAVSLTGLSSSLDRISQTLVRYEGAALEAARGEEVLTRAIKARTVAQEQASKYTNTSTLYGPDNRPYASAQALSSSTKTEKSLQVINAEDFSSQIGQLESRLETKKQQIAAYDNALAAHMQRARRDYLNGPTGYANQWNYQRNESPLYSDLFAQADRRDISEFNQEQKRRSARIAARESFTGRKFEEQGFDVRAQEDYARLFDQISTKESAAKKAASDETLRGLSYQERMQVVSSRMGAEQLRATGSLKEYAALLGTSEQEAAKIAASFVDISKAGARPLLTGLSHEDIANINEHIQNPGYRFRQAQLTSSIDPAKQIAEAERLSNRAAVEWGNVTASQIRAAGSLKEFGDEIGVTEKEAARIAAQSIDASQGRSRGQFSQFSRAEAEAINRELESEGLALSIRPNWLQKEGEYLRKNLISWTAVGGTILVAKAAMESFVHSVQEASKVQVQGVLFQAYQQSRTDAGLPTDKTSPTQITSEAVRLAAAYGDNVNDVVQDLELWYKRTGDLNSAIYMTSQALEFQVATGTQLEDTYRTLTALGAQLTGQKMGGGLGGTFDLSRTHEFLQLITAAAVAAGAGLHQFSEKGRETEVNSGSILTNALEKDAAALRSLGFTTVDTVAINQSLIQSMGNTGKNAEEAAEKISRLAGGIAGLSKPSKMEGLKKEGIDLSGLDTSKPEANTLQQIAQIYEKLTPAKQKDLAVTLAGNRQYEALQALLDALPESAKLATDTIHNMGLEDQLAAQMQDTFQQSTKKLQGAWEGLEISLGGRILPALTTAIQSFTQNVIPMLNDLSFHIGQVSGGLTGLGTGMALAKVAPGPLKIPAMVGGFVYGQLTGQEEDEKNQDVMRYGMGFLKYRKQINGYIEATKSIGFLGGNTTPPPMSPEMAYWLKVKQERDAEVETFRSLEQTGPVKGTYTDRNKKSHVYTRFISQADLYAAHHAWMKYDPEIQSEMTNEALRNPQVARDLFNSQQAQPGLSNLNSDNGGKQGPLSDESAAAGALKDYQVLGQTFSDLRDKYRELDEEKKVSLTLDAADIAHKEKLISTYGVSAQGISALQSAVNKKKSDDAGYIAGLGREANLFQNYANTAKAQAAKQAPGTEEQRGFLQQYYQANQEVRRIQQEITQLIADQGRLNDSVAQYKAELATTTLEHHMRAQGSAFSNLQKQFGSAVGLGDKEHLAQLMGQAAETNYQNNIAELNRDHASGALVGEKYQQQLERINEQHEQDKTAAADAAESEKKFGQTLQDNLSKSLISSQRKGLDYIANIAGDGGDPNQKAKLDYYRDIINLQREYQDEQVQIGQYSREAAGDPKAMAMVDQYRQSVDAMTALGEQAAVFKERLEEIKNSDWYKGLDAALSDMVNLAGTSLDNTILGNDKLQSNVNGLEATVNLLEKQKQLTQEVYGLQAAHSPMQEANNKLAQVQYEQQIAAAKQMEAENQAKINNPTGLRGILGSFSKAYSSDLLQMIQKNIEGGLLGTAGQDAQKVLADSINTSFVPGTHTFQQAVSDFITQGVNPLKESLTGSGNYVDTASTQSDALNNYSDVQSQLIDQQHTLMRGVDANINIGGGGAGSLFTSQLGQGIVSALSMGLASSGHNVIGTALSEFGPSLSKNKNLSEGMQNLGYEMSTLGNVINGFGTSTTAGIGSLLGGGIGAMLGGPLGASIGSSILGMIGSFFGPHYNRTNNPDMYTDSGYSQYMANATGSSNTQSNGQTSEDISLYQGLGEKSELQYIDSFVKAHPGGAGLTGPALDMWKKMNTMTGGGSATQIGYGGVAGAIHQGQQGLMDASGNQIGGTENWQQLSTTIQNTTQQLLTFQGGLNGANQSLVVFNAFGTGNTQPMSTELPSYMMPSGNYTVGGNMSTVAYGNNVPTTPTTNRGTETQAINLNITTQLDGRTIAQSTQAYQVQAKAQGYSLIP